MDSHESEKSLVEKMSMETFNATCIHCGETKDIQLWPHRNGQGNMIGFVFACAGCADVVRGITLEIHGIRGHSAETPKPSPPEPTCSTCNGRGWIFPDRESTVEHHPCPACHPIVQPTPPPAPAKLRRMQANPLAMPGSAHWLEHDEREGCARGAPCQPVPAKPRRMRGNPHCARGSDHGREHNEDQYCAVDKLHCEPVDPR